MRTIDRDGKQIIWSFKDAFYSVGKTNDIIQLKQALDLDSKTYSVIRKANMFEYFRLADMEPNSLGDIKGKAVLILCSNEEPTLKNFNCFQNIEKMRLMLLIKEEFFGLY